MSVHVFGIRHHGPGCARSLLGALAALAPDVVLIEGPPDAQEVLPFAGHADIAPPVALLVYPVDAPKRAVFYPFAEFSPEWQAIRWALSHEVDVRFMDLPQAHRMAEPDLDVDMVAASAEPPPTTEPSDREERAERDPLDLFAEAAGYTDHELWWEHQIERHRDATDLFDAIREAMHAVRGDAPPKNALEARREAYMRTVVRGAEKDGRERIAVVCGAWHAPVLVDHSTAKADAALLKGLPKVKVEATWIPWTHSRLSFRSGYGAGVHAPGWYAHLWTAPDHAVTRWAVEAARLLRSEDLDAPSASVIEVVRLADTLAALRGLRSPGLAELNESAVSILCHGEPARLRLVRERLEVGEVLGRVPADAPTVPLQRDLQALQKRLRLKVSGEIKPLELDLRNETDRERSRLFHRLTVLDVAWAAPKSATRGKLGTFNETWSLRWVPEMEVALIEASVWGNTVEGAADSRARHLGEQASHLGALTPILDRALLAELPGAVEELLARVQERAAVGADVQHLMLALPPLVRASRYGDVRRTPTEALLAVIGALFERVVVGLRHASVTLDADAAAERLRAMIGVQESLGILDDGVRRAEWAAVLGALADDDAVHGLLRGWSCRSLFEHGHLDAGHLERRARLALSPVVPALDAAAWIEGLLQGAGLALLHQDGVWIALDRYVVGLSSDAFQEMLPLLRRAFSGFSGPERRMLAERLKDLHPSMSGRARAHRVSDPAAAAIDHRRAGAVLPVLARILGVNTG
ncbi:MAG: hypothetical protein DMD35_19805 [Gemmatimonadetes bacterium]|nr:MAG: hypothetical protein DMD35_19805 [Gemmatimonadota bacterium]